jgi:hypothetical protein
MALDSRGQRAVSRAAHIAPISRRMHLLPHCCPVPAPEFTLYLGLLALLLCCAWMLLESDSQSVRVG